MNRLFKKLPNMTKLTKQPWKSKVYKIIQIPKSGKYKYEEAGMRWTCSHFCLLNLKIFVGERKPHTVKKKLAMFLFFIFISQ